jgi:hypothetical protein
MTDPRIEVEARELTQESQTIAYNYFRILKNEVDSRHAGCQPLPVLDIKESSSGSSR